MTIKVKTIGNFVYLVMVDEFGEEHTLMLSNSVANEFGKTLIYASTRDTTQRTYEHTLEVNHA